MELRPDTVLEAVHHWELQTQIADHTLQEAVAMARRQGHSWQEIADQLGCTRQAAQQRYGPRCEGR